MKLELTTIAGPHRGKRFLFEGRDSFLVGRAADAHFRLSDDDPYFSRRHFLIEVNPPRCRVTDLSKRNGTSVNGVQVQSAEVRDGDEIGAGHTVFKLRVIAADPGRPPAGDPPTDGTVDHVPAAVAIPGYRIDGELGRGGMGVVYRATRQRDGLAVALKTIAPSAGASRKQIDRFVRESEILGRLDHPHIVAFHEVGEAAGAIYLVMELVDGLDLNARLRLRGPMEVRTAVRIVCQVLKGLAHAHDKGFVHRDIKPANILIGRAGAMQEAKLADFGLARAYEASEISGLTMQGETGGTPAFMAPEQVTHYRDVRPAADQYSAAATLYFALTGKNVHDLPRGLGEQIAHVVTAPPVPITDRRADIPAGLAAAVHKALSREPGERYADVMAFRKELKRYA